MTGRSPSPNADMPWLTNIYCLNSNDLPRYKYNICINKTTHYIHATVNSLTCGPMPTTACDHVGHGLGKTPFRANFPYMCGKKLNILFHQWNANLNVFLIDEVADFFEHCIDQFIIKCYICTALTCFYIAQIETWLNSLGFKNVGNLDTTVLSQWYFLPGIK